jgi:O-antigen/teichoic acid export membrane protein
MKELGLHVRSAVRSTEAHVILAIAVQGGAASLFALLTARWLGPASRGSVVVFMTTSSFLMLVGSLGVSTGARVLLNNSPPLSLNTYLKKARLLSAVHLVTSSSVGLFTLTKTGGMPTWGVGVIFVPFAAIQLFSYFQREALHGMGRHRTALYGDVLSSTLQTAAVLLLKVAGRLSLTAVCLVVLGGSVAQAAFLAVRLQSTPQSPPSTNYSLKRLIRYSLPAVVTTLGQAFVIRGDRLILGLIAGAAPVGIYGTAATFTELIWLLPAGVAQVAFRKASVVGLDPTRARVRTLTLLITALMCVALAACTQFLVTALLGAKYYSAVGLVYILIAASLPMASYQLDVAVLNGLGRLSDSGRATMLGSIALVAGCLISIPKYGAYGAAWSSLGAYTAMATLARIDMRRAKAGNISA